MTRNRAQPTANLSLGDINTAFTFTNSVTVARSKFCPSGSCHRAVVDVVQTAGWGHALYGQEDAPGTAVGWQP